MKKEKVQNKPAKVESGYSVGYVCLILAECRKILAKAEKSLSEGKLTSEDAHATLIEINKKIDYLEKIVKKQY